MKFIIKKNNIDSIIHYKLITYILEVPQTNFNSQLNAYSITGSYLCRTNEIGKGIV